MSNVNYRINRRVVLADARPRFAELLLAASLACSLAALLVYGYMGLAESAAPPCSYGVEDGGHHE